MELYDEAWHSTSRSTIIKCSMKSKCLPESHHERGIALLNDLGMESSANSTSLQSAVSHSEAQHIARDFNVIQSLNTPDTPLSEILQEAEPNNNAATIMEVLNSTAPFYKEPSRSEVAAAVLNEMYDAEEPIFSARHLLRIALQVKHLRISL